MPVITNLPNSNLLVEAVLVSSTFRVAQTNLHPQIISLGIYIGRYLPRSIDFRRGEFNPIAIASEVPIAGEVVLCP